MPQGCDSCEARAFNRAFKSHVIERVSCMPTPLHNIYNPACPTRQNRESVHSQCLEFDTQNTGPAYIR